MENLVLAYALIVIGMVLMGAEILLLTHGVLFALGIGGLIAGLAMVFHESTTRGFITLVVVFVLMPILGPILIHYWPQTTMGRRIILNGPEDDTTVANMPTNLELEQLRGRYGKTVSALRPSGVTEFDGRRVDTISEGDMIEPGQWVKCIDVKAARVVVRQVDRPPDLGEMEPGDLRG